jgi:hypothetical protein
MNQSDLPDLPTRCAICRQELDGDQDDEPFPPLGPMCGECYRAQQMDDEIDAAQFSNDDEGDLGF